jgi:hypothetical protein
MNHILEVDLPAEIKASLTTTCDGCGKVIGESYPRGRNTLSLALAAGQDADGYESWKQHHFCNEACLRTALNKRAEPKA